jgi:putative DNA primase/helicase
MVADDAGLHGHHQDRDEVPLHQRPKFPPPSAPLNVARRLYAEYRQNHTRTMVYWHGGWMVWRGAHWSEMDAAELRSTIYGILGDAAYTVTVKAKGEAITQTRPWDPDKRKVANVMEAMAAIGHLSADIDPPAWVSVHSTAETPAAQMISCANGVLDLSTQTFHSHTPALFNVVSVPFDYDENATSPTEWLDFLASIWLDDSDSILLLQEYFGYVLSGRLDMQKMLLLIGPTRSGKGTIARILTELVGRGHVAGPTLASLGTNFGLSPLLGKPLAIISDARLGNIPSHTVVERLLSITGEDMLTVDRKYRDPWTGKLPTRFVILTNELPRFRDSSGAIANRLLILRMTESFLGREDLNLQSRLRPELPGILLWALEGLDRLNVNGKFTEPESSRDAGTLMMDLASPVSAFVRDRCARRPDVSVPVDDLYHFWKSWAEANGHHPGAKSTFGRDLRAVVPELKLTNPRIKGVPVRHYQGLTLKSSTHNGPDPSSPSSQEHSSPNSGAKSLFGEGDEGDEGTTPMWTQSHVNPNGHSSFEPPSGPGRCDRCGFHIKTQGHRADCTTLASKGSAG